MLVSHWLHTCDTASRLQRHRQRYARLFSPMAARWHCVAVEGYSGIRRRCGQKKAEHVMAQGRPGVRLIAMVFSLHTLDTQAASLPVFSFYFYDL